MNMKAADPTTLMKQASMTANAYFCEAVHSIDNLMGHGYAKKNPALVMEMINTASKDYEVAIKVVDEKETMQEIASMVTLTNEAIHDLADALDRSTDEMIKRINA